MKMRLTGKPAMLKYSICFAASAILSVTQALSAQEALPPVPQPEQSGPTRVNPWTYSRGICSTVSDEIGRRLYRHTNSAR